MSPLSLPPPFSGVWGKTQAAGGREEGVFIIAPWRLKVAWELALPFWSGQGAGPRGGEGQDELGDGGDKAGRGDASQVGPDPPSSLTPAAAEVPPPVLQAETET